MNKIDFSAGIFNANTFLDLEIPARKAIINPWILEKSICLISGPRGLGKSNFAIGAVKAVCQGANFGPWKTEPVNTLYLDAEMTGDDMQLRIMDIDPGKLKSELLIYCDDIAREKTGIRANFHNEKWRDQFKSYLLSENIKLWVADNIASLSPGTDENSKEAWDVANQWLITLKHTGIATGLIHHTGKNGDQRGTSGREDNIDFSVLLKAPKGYRAEDGARFIVHFTKHRTPNRNLPLLKDKEFKLIETPNGSEWTYANVEQARRDNILELISNGFSVSEISKELKIDKAYVSRVKNGKK
jgi:putative DNA primase/helicase